MDDTYLDVLKLLQPYGIDRQVDVSNNIYILFKTQPEVDSKETIDNINDRIAHFCVKMQTNAHISGLVITNKPVDEIGYWYVSMRLTYLGLEYLNGHRLTVSNINLNDSIRTNIKVQLAIGFFTLIAIITTAVIAFMAYNKGDSENLILLRKSMQQQEQILQQMQQLQKERNTYLKIMATKTSPKKK